MPVAIPTSQLTSPPGPTVQKATKGSIHASLHSHSNSPSSTTHTVVRPPSPTAPSQEYKFTHNVETTTTVASTAIPFLAPGATVYGSPIEVVEAVAYERSSSVWVWEDASLIGFGARLSEWEEEYDNGAKVFEMQTRQGAGSALVGFVRSILDNKIEISKPITLFTTPSSFKHLLPSLHALSTLVRSHVNGSFAPRVIVDIATTSIADSTLTFKESLDEALVLVSSLSTLEEWSVSICGSAEEIVASSAVDGEKWNINILETTFIGREIRSLVYPGKSTISPYTVHGTSLSSSNLFIVPSSTIASTLLTTTATSQSCIIVISTLSNEILTDLASTHLLSHSTIHIIAPSQSSAHILRDAVLGGIYTAAFGNGSASAKKIPIIKTVVVEDGDVVSRVNVAVEGIVIMDVKGSAVANGNASGHANGHVNGHANGHANGHSNGHSNGHANGHSNGNAIHDSDETPSKTISLYTSQTSPLATSLAHIFLSSPGLTTRLARFGSSVDGGVKSVLELAPGSKSKKAVRSLGVDDNDEDLIWISEAMPLKSMSAVSGRKSLFEDIKVGGVVVLSLPGWSEEDVEVKLSPRDKKIIRDRHVRVFVLPTLAGSDTSLSGVIFEEIAFFLLYTSLQKLSKGVQRVLEAFHGHEISRDQVEAAQAGLLEVESIPTWQIGEEEEVSSSGLRGWEWDALSGPEGVTASNAGQPIKADWPLAAKHLLFREAFAYNAGTDATHGVDTRGGDEADISIQALRPSIPDQTFLVKVSENRRLTPETYDRNVFHLAFDTSGTGLKYEIGEALGIHGWNDEEEVREFIEWYGLDPQSLVSYPSPHDGGKTYETRTVFQLLQQNLDLFGKPSKSFYASLALLARSREDERTLRFIAAPEGVALFKKMSEKLTVTFADVLKQFTTARPSIEELVGLIPEIKPRHYSIASSQKAMGDCVELLIVTVDWTTPTGSPRYGQCTRYLADLKVGQEVTVSIKPSVMKLPPLDSQPIIMAGLGTGAAPFRAFMQHRAWQKGQGVDVGPLIYYFGSRYRSQEYLYGEEIEAYIASGIIGHAGLAFSRDGKDKMYIQHKMMQDKKMLAKMLTATGPDAAYFYLCGPTWPVPDVFEALVGSLTEEAGKERKEAEDYIEELKEEERYVLEVY